MKYLKEIKSGRAFSATFTNGEKSKSYQASCFFMVMQDKGVPPSDLDSYIKLGGMMEPFKDWSEIKRIAATFTRNRVAV